MKSVEFANYVLNVSKDMNIRLNVEQLQMVMFMVYVEYYYKYDSCLFMDHWILENRRLHIEHVWYMFCGYGMTEICPFLEREVPTLSMEVESMCRFYIKEIKKTTSETDRAVSDRGISSNNCFFWQEKVFSKRDQQVNKT